MSRRLDGPYRTVFRHLTRTRGWSGEAALAWIDRRSFRVIVRASNRITRARILARADHHEGGYAWDSTRMSSRVPV